MKESTEVAENERPRSYIDAKFNSVKRILNCNQDDYFGILEVDENATEKEVRQAFKNQALLIRPNENYAPGTYDAIKMVIVAKDQLIWKIKLKEKEEQDIIEDLNVIQNTKRHTSNSGNNLSPIPGCSTEDLNIVERIISCNPNDFHDILNIEKNASTEEIKIAFIALKQTLFNIKTKTPNIDRVRGIVVEAGRTYYSNNSDDANFSFGDLQIEVRRILRCNPDDYYSILNIDNEASLEDIQKSVETLKEQFILCIDMVNGAGRALRILTQAFKMLVNQSQKDEKNTRIQEKPSTLLSNQKHNATSNCQNTLSSTSLYTSEDLNLVEIILSSDPNDFYTILNIDKIATDEEIKIAFKHLKKKLCLKKSVVPRADEAFKIVKEALQWYNLKKHHTSKFNSNRAYSTENLDTVERILECDPNDYYSILDVEKTVTAEEIKQAFKNLKKKLRPMRNLVPGAHEASKIVKEACKLYNQQQLTSNSTNNSISTLAYSTEDLKIIERILSCDPDDYFCILNIDKNASDKVIRKGFEKLKTKLFQISWAIKRPAPPKAGKALKIVLKASQMYYEKTTNISFDDLKIIVKRIQSCDQDDYYNILDIHENATIEDIRKSAETLQKKLYPGIIVIKGAGKALGTVKKASKMLKKQKNSNKKSIKK